MMTPLDRTYRILLVDDDPDDRLIVQELLDEVDLWGADLVCADSYERAVAELEGGGFDVALVDMQLGARKGIELIEEPEIRRSGLPIVILTGMRGQEVDGAALEAGAADFLPKAELSGPLLERTIRYTVEHRRRHRSERRFQALIESSRDLLTILDAAGRIQYVSPSLVRMLGFEPDARTGIDVMGEVHPEDVAKVGEAFAELLRNPGQTKHLQYRVAHRDHSWRVFDTIAQNFLADPLIGGIVVNSWDVTELRRTQERLTDTANVLRQTVASLEEVVLMVRMPERVIVDCNAAVERVFGRRPAELRNQSTRILHADEESYRRFRQVYWPELERTGRYHGEYEFNRADGSVVPAEITITLMDPDAGPSGGLVAVIRDLTERLRRERQTRFQAELLQRVGQPVLAVDEQARVTYWNEAAATLTGWTREELEGEYLLDRLVAPEDRTIGLLARETALAGKPWEGEIRVRHKDGGTSIMQATVTPAVNPDGTPGGRIATGADITERRKLEEQLRQAQKMEAIGRLAGGVAHDFNNLLTAIDGHSSLLLEDLPPDPGLREDVRQIRQAAERAAALTRQLLAFSRKQVLQERTIGLGALVLDLEPMLQRLIPERIQLDVVPSPHETVVDADPGQLTQVVLNLVVNAVDAIEGGGTITLRLDTRTVAADDAEALHWQIEPGPYVRLTAQDTGRGMAPDVLDHVFEPFYTTKDAGKGTGLGLSTVYGIVKQSRGHILVRSEPGRGTTFEVLLPHGTGEPSDREAEASPGIEEGGGVVLLVEDEPSVRNLARRILERAGYSVLEAADGREGLDTAERHEGRIDLLLTDVVMPEMSGVELERRVRDRYPGVRAIFTSGYSEAEVLEEIRGRDAAFVAKPFTPEELSRTVAGVLSDDSSTPARRGNASALRTPRGGLPCAP